MFKRNKPITIVVTDGRYYCYGPTTRRSNRLFAVLERCGGINETVPDGVYHYNIKMQNSQIIASLYPIK